MIPPGAGFIRALPSGASAAHAPQPVQTPVSMTLDRRFWIGDKAAGGSEGLRVDLLHRGVHQNRSGESVRLVQTGEQTEELLVAEVEMVASRYVAYRDYMKPHGGGLPLTGWFRFYCQEKASESGDQTGGAATDHHQVEMVTHRRSP